MKVTFKKPKVCISTGHSIICAKNLKNLKNLSKYVRKFQKWLYYEEIRGWAWTENHPVYTHVKTDAGLMDYTRPPIPEEKSLIVQRS